MIHVGDIVRRKASSGRDSDEGGLNAYRLFVDGYFMVLKTLSQRSSYKPSIVETVCLIMNDKGMISWIDGRLLKIEIRLNNE